MTAQIVHFAKTNGKWWIALCGVRTRLGGKHATVFRATGGVSNCPTCCSKAEVPLSQI